MIPLITLEEHYISPISRTLPKDVFAEFPPHIVTKLSDLSTTRINDMNAGQVSLQILSHGPLEADLETCTTANNELAAAIASNPTRLSGFALLPMTTPEAAANELTRCVQTHHFVGALLDAHLDDGTFYDDPKFHPVFAAAETLNVPLYIHPTFASDSMMTTLYKGNYPASVALSLSAFGFGWHATTALSLLRLWASGFFDAFPKLKIIIGHMGELLPFQIDRIAPQTSRWGSTAKRSFRHVWDENVWVTTSGMFSLAPLACLLQTKGKDKVLFSVDYPFSSNETGLKFWEEIRGSGLLSEEELEDFSYRNAERLLGVKAVYGKS